MSKNNNFNFMFCNNHTFEDIKNKNIEELDYEKAYDLAVIENREKSISAYLGVYNDEFELTYSVHSKNDFDSNLENVAVELIDIAKINSEKELKDTMIAMTNNYFKDKEKIIETLSNRLNEDYSNDTIYKIETNIPGAAKVELVRIIMQALNLVTVESMKDGYVFTYEKQFFNENAEVATVEDIKNYEFELNEEESEVL